MKWGLAGVAAVVVAGALAFGVVGVTGKAEAQAPPGGGDRRGRFEQILAQKLGVSVDVLHNAQKAARDQMIDEAVTAGRITAQEATRLKSGQPGIPGQGPGQGRGQARGMGLRAGLTDVLQTAAGSMGMTTDQLRLELRTKTLAQVAAEHGRTPAQIKATLATQIKADLQKAVGSGRMTQAQADRMLNGLDQMLDRLINRQAGQGFGPGTRPARPDRN